MERRFQRYGMMVDNVEGLGRCYLYLISASISESGVGRFQVMAQMHVFFAFAARIT